MAGQGLISLLTAVVGVSLLVVGVLWALFRKRRLVAQHRAWRAVMFVFLGVATLATMRLHTRTAEARSAQVIEACRSYQHTHGALPEQLQDLVPELLESVPHAKMTILFSEFMYWSSNGEHHTLQYVSFPPSGRRLYHFESDSWSRLD